MSASRYPAQILAQHDRLCNKDRYNQFMALGQMVGSGPPLFRTRELLTLVDAGFVTFLGAQPTVSVDGKEFVMVSPTTNTEVRSSTLVDAWMHNPDVHRPGDALTQGLLRTGRLRPFRDTAAPEVDPLTRRVVNASGQVDSSLYLIGIPTAGQYAGTTFSPVPGTDALMLQETDAVVADLIASFAVTTGEA